MSADGKAQVKIGTLTGSTGGTNEDPYVAWLNTNTSVGTYAHASDRLASFVYDASNDNFCLNKKTQDVAGQETEIMKVDSNGLVTFNTMVNFTGGSSTLNTATTSIEDHQFELGLADSINITSIVSIKKSWRVEFTYNLKTLY